VSLTEYGWSQVWADRLAQSGGGEAARVVAEHRGQFKVWADAEELVARTAGRLRHAAASSADLPAVGDWVVIDRAGEGGEVVIRTVLPRTSVFSRKVPGRRATEQVVGANIDIVWVVTPIEAARNAARIERYVTLVWEGGASPVVVLTKVDLASRPEAEVASLAVRLTAVPVHAVSAVDGAGLDELRGYLAPGVTIVLLGPSGVGKSTLINRLAGREVMATGSVRAADGKGRHTTRHRQLVLLPSGGLLLDTPGMRELQPWGAEDGLEKSFADIEELAAACRFSDCLHETEPGCAVLGAVEDGELEEARLASWRKLQKELAHIERRRELRADLEERQRWKAITKEFRRSPKRRT
jgi:ribosome biogenesis GTPase